MEPIPARAVRSGLAAARRSKRGSIVSNALFWISLASAVIVFAAMTFFRFSHGEQGAESPQADDLSDRG